MRTLLRFLLRYNVYHSGQSKKGSTSRKLSDKSKVLAMAVYEFLYRFCFKV